MKPTTKKYLINFFGALPGFVLLGLLGTGYFSKHGCSGASCDSDMAASLLRKGQYDEAMPYLDKAISADPNNFNAFNNRGIVYGKKKQFDLALADFDRALQIQPESAMALTTRGMVYFLKGQYDLAIKDVDDAMRIKAADPRTLIIRGNIYTAQGAYDKAVQDYTSSIQLDDRGPSAYLDRGQAELYGGQTGPAADDMARAVSRTPGDFAPVLWLHIARIHAGQDDQEEMERNGAPFLNGKWPAPIIALYMNKGSVEDVYAKAKNDDVAAQGYQLCEANFYVAESYLQKSMKDDAKKLFDVASRECPADYVESVFSRAELKLLGP